MKKIFIKDIREKDQVSDAFLVSKKESGVSKTGKTYLNLRVLDSTGEIEARVWDNAAELAGKFDRNDVVKVRGFAVAYQGKVQLNITDIYALREDEYSIRDFLPASPRDPQQMIEELDAVIARVADRHIRGLLTSIFTDQEVRERFKQAPAAKAMHHPYLGGLLEHVLSICGLVDKVCEHYGTMVNKSLLIAGAILHDIGKIYELSYSRAIEYTDEGRLIGHITMGVELVDGKMREIKDFPNETMVLLKHMLLSHHGSLEFGSPKRPKTLEAILLSYLDDMDAKVNAVHTLMETAREDGSSWSPYQRMFERYIYTAGSKAEDDAEPSGGESVAGETAEAQMAGEPAVDETGDKHGSGTGGKGGKDGSGSMNLFG